MIGGSGAGKKGGRLPSWQRERDRLLRDSGFVDLEDESGWMAPILQEHGHIIGRQRTHQEIESLAEYYRAAGKLLHEHAFKTPVERRIWELHADGASYTRIWHTVRREIESGALPREKMYRRRVHACVTRLRGLIMGAGKRRPGRKQDPDSLRSHGMVLRVRMAPEMALALDHLRATLKATRADVVRKGLALLEKSIR